MQCKCKKNDLLSKLIRSKSLFFLTIYHKMNRKGSYFSISSGFAPIFKSAEEVKSMIVLTTV